MESGPGEVDIPAGALTFTWLIGGSTASGGSLGSFWLVMLVPPPTMMASGAQTMAARASSRGYLRKRPRPKYPSNASTTSTTMMIQIVLSITLSLHDQ
jgi:hypothetical protein